MAHQIEQIAYVGETPWHGLGNQLSPKQPLEVWAQQAGMDWRIESSNVSYMAQNERGQSIIMPFEEQRVLYRSDTHAPLSVVSQRYQEVQPKEILEFYRDLTEQSGFELETAGVLKGGKKFWALARTGQSTALKVKDVSNGYILLATACDGTLATTAQFTSIRVVCNNTLAIALRGQSSSAGVVKVPHSTKFDAEKVKQQLGISVRANQELTELQKNHLSTVNNLLYSFDLDTEKHLLRLELQYEESKNFLDTLILKEKYEGENTASIQKMRAAYNQIYNYLENILQKGVPALTKFARYFMSKIDLVLIESEDIGSALKIFETINQRGASLNAMDLVKNLLFRQANESQFSTIKETWKNINEALLRCGEHENPLRFLRYFMMARYHNGILREDDIYNWIITKAGKAILKYETHPIELVKEIESMAQRYANLVNATKRLGDGSDYPHVTHIGFINKYKARQHLIMLLALSKQADKAAIDYLAQQIESFYFVTNTVGILGKSNEHSFANWVVSFRGKTTIEEIQQVVEKTIVPYVLERLDNLKFKFLNIRHDGYNPQYRQRFILGQLENQARIQAGLTEFNFKQIGQLEIEHIFPQTPKDDVLPEEFLDKAEYNNTIYKLGNVTLLESVINQAINKMNDLTTNWFEQKQQEYAKSNLLTVNLLDHEYNIGKQTAITRFKDDKNYIFESWSKQAIIDRQKIMLDLALDVWRFNGQRLDQYQFAIEHKDTVNA